MREITVDQAVAEALKEEMRMDRSVVYMGEGVATDCAHHPYGFLEEFGRERVRNTPLAEGIIAGTAAGAAATGLRPVIDLLFVPFICFAMDEIINSAGKLRYMSGGQFNFPLVIIARTGCGWTVGAQHNHNLEAWFCHSPGIKVVMPSNPSDFKGLLKSSIRDNNPVIFIQDLALTYMKGEVPEGEHLVPLGQGKVVRQGGDITFISWGKTVYTCLKAASALSQDGIEAEVIDLRTLKPLDEELILSSVKRTGRLIVVHEASRTGGFGGEICAIVAEKVFPFLKAPVKRITGPDVPPPASYALELLFVPQEGAVVDGARELCSLAAR